jgi:hypothetical protein
MGGSSRSCLELIKAQHGGHARDVLRDCHQRVVKAEHDLLALNPLEQLCKSQTRTKSLRHLSRALSLPAAQGARQCADFDSSSAQAALYCPPRALRCIASEQYRFNRKAQAGAGAEHRSQRKPVWGGLPTGVLCFGVGVDDGRPRLSDA